MKMEFGQFDDSFFDDNEEKQEKRHVESYTANQCPPEWFVDPHMELTSDTGRQVLKYRADWFYHRKSFDKAVQTFSELLELVPLTNTAMRRDVKEALARCHMGLQDYDKALSLALELSSEAQNFEQRTSSLDLLSHLYEQTQNWTAMMLSLERLLTLHPQSAAKWRRLASTYVRIYARSPCPDKHSSLEQEPQTSSITVSPDVTCGMENLCLESALPGQCYSELPTHGCIFGALSALEASAPCDCGQQCVSPAELVATCLIRTGILLHSSKYGLAEWVKRKIKCDQKDVREKLALISFEPEREDACSVFLSGDLQTTSNPDNDRSSDSSPEQIIQETDLVVHNIFLRKWTAWKKHLKAEL